MIENDRDIARFCLAIINLERCFCVRPGKAADREEGIALELYRNIKDTQRRVTKGQLEVLIRVYQDLIRVRYSDGFKVAHCAHRIGETRHPRGVSMHILRTARPEDLMLEAHHHLCLT